jgi:ATP synthase protein I
VKDEPDDRAAFAQAAEWTSLVTTVAAEMSLPALGGYWLDRWLGTKAVFLVLGAVFGLVMGLWHLLKMAGTASKRKN